MKEPSNDNVDLSRFETNNLEAEEESPVFYQDQATPTSKPVQKVATSSVSGEFQPRIQAVDRRLRKIAVSEAAEKSAEPVRYFTGRRLDLAKLRITGRKTDADIQSLIEAKEKRLRKNAKRLKDLRRDT